MEDQSSQNDKAESPTEFLSQATEVNDDNDAHT